MAMCALRMLDDGTLKKRTVVATVMSQPRARATRCARNGAKLVRTQVGDRYVVEAMRAGGYNLGGEQSGHLVFLDHASTGDGIVAALQVLAIMLRTGKPALRARRARDAARAAGARERHPARAQAPRADAAVSAR